MNEPLVLCLLLTLLPADIDVEKLRMKELSIMAERVEWVEP